MTTRSWRFCQVGDDWDLYLVEYDGLVYRLVTRSTEFDLDDFKASAILPDLVFVADGDDWTCEEV